MRQRGIWAAIIAAGLGGGAMYYISEGLHLYTGPDAQTVGVLAPIAMAIAVLYTYVLSMALMEIRRRRYFFDRIRFGLVDALQRDEKQIAEQAQDGQLDLPSLWAATQRRIDVYHEIATSQAASSFKIGQIAMISGFGVVVLLGIVAAFAKDGTASIAASVAGVAGAAMGAYIGSTFMKAQAEASAQLSQFFLQPVEFARLLGAERLLETLEPSERSVAVQRVIETMMISTGKASDPKTTKPDAKG